MSGLAKTLRDAREAASPRLSQSKVARLLGMDVKTVGRWERGESVPELETLSRLAELYGLEWCPLLRLWSKEKLGTTSREAQVDEISERSREEMRRPPDNPRPPDPARAPRRKSRPARPPS
jgi:transcriptional regulator with XRE-family HTH domain